MLRPPWSRTSFGVALAKTHEASESAWWLERTLRTLPILDVSATEVRSRIAAGKPLANLVSHAVEAYIREHGLYAKPMG